MKELTVLSLFDYSGVWSEPYVKAGYHVVRVDLKHGVDILTIDKKWLDENIKYPVYGILAAPPCTDFSVSGARWWKFKDADGRTQHSIKLVKKTLAIIRYLKPTFWALENPIGRISKLLRGQLSPKPKLYFQPHNYAQLAVEPCEEQYTKKTCLWGTFNVPNTAPLPPVLGSKMHLMSSSWEKLYGLRSKTPSGFAKAFYLANNIESDMYEHQSGMGDAQQQHLQHKTYS